MKATLYLFLSVMILYSCNKPLSNPGADREVEGMIPQYENISNETVFASDAQAIMELKNIYAYKDKILVVESLKGIHVIDNSNPRNPKIVAFWNIPAVTNFTQSNGTLYAPIGNDLVMINVQDIHNIKLLGVKENVFESREGAAFPTGYVGSFECIDPSKGEVTSWMEGTLFNPKCWR